MDAIAQYRREWDETKGMFRERPYHDWTSHAADVHRYAAIVEKEMMDEKPRPVPERKPFWSMSIYQGR